MKQVNIHEAKTHLSKLLQRVLGGEEITIAKSGVPVARLTAIKASRPKSFLGIDRERLKVPSDFDDPLPADILAGFWGGKEPGINTKPRRKRKK
ncbi:MAG TPA: type II toxin-antitoxin system Phd/YefM family antitoxin [Candidatus Angelobacter sp.]|jgi:prevent-host-death family protein|nr:type II toxin-antitoxin system Phd/YefM family antitoxin [Candidatus Angelobacter sp.]